MRRGRVRTKLIQLNRMQGLFGIKVVGGKGSSLPPAVADLQPGGPAESSKRVKILVGDLILSIDGRDVTKLTQTEVAKVLLQAPDSCQFIFQTNIQEKEKLLEFIRQRLEHELRNQYSTNGIPFADGEFYSTNPFQPFPKTASEFHKHETVARNAMHNKLSTAQSYPTKKTSNYAFRPISFSDSDSPESSSTIESRYHESVHSIEGVTANFNSYSTGNETIQAIHIPSSSIISETSSVVSAMSSGKDSPCFDLYKERSISVSDMLNVTNNSGYVTNNSNYVTNNRIRQNHSLHEKKSEFTGSFPNLHQANSWSNSNKNNNNNNNNNIHSINLNSSNWPQLEGINLSPSSPIYCEPVEDDDDDDYDYGIQPKTISRLSLDNRLNRRGHYDFAFQEKANQLRSSNCSTNDRGGEYYADPSNKYNSLPHLKTNTKNSFQNESKTSQPVFATGYKPKSNIFNTYEQYDEENDVKDKARNMFNLRGFTDQEVCDALAGNTLDAKELGMEYIRLYTFGDTNITEALRYFLRKIKLSGESQEQERVIEFFSMRYHECNSSISSVMSKDAVHFLVCSLLLLNSDIHGQNIAKSMTLKDFYENLQGQCDGKNFPTQLLKQSYNSIKKRPLETGSQAQITMRKSTSSYEKNEEIIQEIDPISILIEGSMVSVTVDPGIASIREGTIHIKNLTDTEGKRIGGKLRQWKLFHAKLMGPLLMLWSVTDKHKFIKDSKRVYPVTHAIARSCPEYTKKDHVLQILTGQRQIVLIDAKDLLDMQGWISAVNLAAALHSAEPMAAALSSNNQFNKPTISIGPSRLAKEKQLAFLEKKIDELESEIENYNTDHITLEILKSKPKHWIKDMLDYKNFLTREIHRYRVYTGCIDLNDKNNLFQNKTSSVYYRSKQSIIAKMAEIEPIIEVPEEIILPPKQS